MTNSPRARIAAVLLSVLTLTLASCAVETPDEPSVTASTSEPTSESEQRAEPHETEGAPEESEDQPENPGLDQQELDERLRGAAWADDLDAAAQLIEWGANVNAQDSTQQSAFLIATSEGLTELARLALEHGADVQDLDSWNGTGLIRAAERGHWEVAGLLVQHDIDMNHVNRVGYQALHEAVWFGRDDPMYHATLRVLVAGGAELNTPSVGEGLTPLQMAYSRGFPEQIAILEALAGDEPGDPQTTLFEAAESGDANAVALALRAGAAVRDADDSGRSALEIAEEGGHFATAAVLRALGG